jgi:hypothetical protein
MPGPVDFGGVQKVIDNVTEISRRVYDLTNTDVLVGIPQAKNARSAMPRWPISTSSAARRTTSRRGRSCIPASRRRAKRSRRR